MIVISFSLLTASWEPLLKVWTSGSLIILMLLSKLPQTEYLTVSMYIVRKSGDRLMCPVLGWVSMFLSETPSGDEVWTKLSSLCLFLWPW